MHENTTANILILRPPLDMVTVDQSENCINQIARESFVVVLIASCVLTILFWEGGRLFQWIEKQSSHGRLLEHLKSSGTKNFDERTYCTPVNVRKETKKL